jgi:RNA polymerase sigma factor (sigma-70 family)
MRAPRYGELGVVNLVSEVKVLWFTRDQELPELPSWRWACEHQTDMKQVEDRDVVRTLLERTELTEREDLVIRMVVIEDCTMQDVGDLLGVTLERVRQILNKGLRKLRHPHALAGLFEPIKRSMQ